MKKNIIIGIVIVIVIVLAFFVFAKPQISSSWQKQYDLGVRYLSEGNYEEAIIAFEAAIKIEPMRVEAYKSLADVYVTVGDVEKAIQTLTEAYAITGDQSLQELIDALRQSFAEKNNLVESPVEISIGGKTFMSDVTELDLRNCEIEDISPLEQCHNLQRLFLGSNYISDINSLSKLTTLTTLDLQDNQIIDISPLKNLVNIGNLHLDGNPIDNIDALCIMKDLRQLSLSGCQISNINALSNCTSLTILYLDNNHIADISSLSNLTNLVELSIMFNQITDIRSLKEFTSLEEVLLTGNPINDYSPVEFVPKVIK